MAKATSALCPPNVIKKGQKKFESLLVVLCILYLKYDQGLAFIKSLIFSDEFQSNSHNLHFNRIGQIFLLCLVFVFDVETNAYMILGFLTHFILEAKINIITIRLLLQAELIMQPL